MKTNRDSISSFIGFGLGAVTGLIVFTAQACGPAPTSQQSPDPGTSGGAQPTASSTAVDPFTGVGGILTYHGDQFRTGLNPNETKLTRNTIDASTFGKVGALPVDGYVYAQPLVLDGVQVPGAGTHNLTFVATEHDSVYAFDADSLSGTPVWHRSFLGDSVLGCSGCSTVSVSDINAPNVAPEIGITSTPVIDPVAGIIYVVATTKESGLFFWKLHALAVGTGAEMPGSPITIQPSVPGGPHAYGLSPDNMIHFLPSKHLQRAGLVLSNGLVYVAFSSYDDQEPTHGWVIAYDSATFAQRYVYMTTPHGGAGNIWMAGAAPAVDENGYLFFSEANGDPNNESNQDPTNSIIKLGIQNSGLGLFDFFQPYDTAQLDDGDVDVGSGGVLLVPDNAGPHTHLLITGGKEGTLYVLDRNNLGQFNGAPGATSNPQIVQELVHLVPGGHSDGPGIYSTPAYFDGNVYLASAGDFLRRIPVLNGQLASNQMTRSNEQILRRGATATISSNGLRDGIVWLIDASDYSYNWNDGDPQPTLTHNGPSVLMAYNSDDLSAPLYRSDRQGSADAAGFAVKFTVPTVYGGKVFVGTQSELSVYGLKN